MPASVTHTPDEVAALYAVSVPTVMGWIRSGELRAVCVSRSARSRKPRYRVTAEALAAFEASRRPTPPAPAAPRRRKASGYTPTFYT
jgi:excisionase family DNA binding protein